MVDIGAKPPMRRRAVAEAFFRARPATIDAILASGGRSSDAAHSGAAPQLQKGDALGVARIAAILAAKHCADLIPLCHTLPLDSVSIDFERCDPGALPHHRYGRDHIQDRSRNGGHSRSDHRGRHPL